MYVCVHVHVCCVCAQCTCICVWVVCADACVCVCINVFGVCFVCMQMCLYPCVPECVCACVCMCVCIHEDIHIYVEAKCQCWMSSSILTFCILRQSLIKFGTNHFGCNDCQHAQEFPCLHFPPLRSGWVLLGLHFAYVCWGSNFSGFHTSVLLTLISPTSIIFFYIKLTSYNLTKFLYWL